MTDRSVKSFSENKRALTVPGAENQRKLPFSKPEPPYDLLQRVNLHAKCVPITHPSYRGAPGGVPGPQVPHQLPIQAVDSTRIPPGPRQPATKPGRVPCSWKKGNGGGRRRSGEDRITGLGSFPTTASPRAWFAPVGTLRTTPSRGLKLLDPPRASADSAPRVLERLASARGGIGRRARFRF